jgi:GNAT superfamily N-acetyltransferase
VPPPLRIRIEGATFRDLDAATACSASAFAGDPLMQYFFAGSPIGVQAASARFFRLLMRVRLALGMPALVGRHGDSIVGFAMGYDTSPPEWPPELVAEWDAFEAAIPGVSERFAGYERIADRYRPERPHYYLGVIAADPGVQGRGVGKAMLGAFCDASDADPRSTGVYLETGSAASLAFYLRNGFLLRGEDSLGSGRLWCVFRPAARQDRIAGTTKRP